MQLDGRHGFQVSREKLWMYLMDPEVLAKITPGVSKLEVTGEDTFKTISDIKLGPVKGAFKGKLNVLDKVEPESFVIQMEQLSKIGNAHAKIHMKIDHAENGFSELTFNGEAKLSGMIARTGQRVLSGVANAVTKEVFASLENHIAEDVEVEVPKAASTIKTKAPETTAPETTAPETTAPETTAPETTASETTAPNKAPKEQLSKPDIKKTPDPVQDLSAKEVAADQASKVSMQEGVQVEKRLETKVEKSVNETSNNSSKGGFFAAIINFFKSIFRGR